MSLVDSTVLIIGGSSGIGHAVARRAKEAGGRLILVGRDAAKLEAAAETLGGSVRTIAADASDPAELARLAAEAGEIDHLVSMAGGAMGGGFLANSEDAVRSAIDEKFFAAVRIAKGLSPNLREGGSLTLTAGAGGRPHNASGAIVGNTAIGMLVQALGVELVPRARANAVAPTWMDTPLWRAVPREDVEATNAHFATQIPLGRTATVDEVAKAYMFLIEFSFINGQTLVVDGGLTLVS